MLLAPESFFGAWQAEIVTEGQYPAFAFYDITGASPTESGVPLLGGYALPELSRLTASAEEISANLAELSGRLEIAFNDETAKNLSQAITDIAAISQQVRDLVTTQSAIATDLTASADSALTEIEAASRAARRTFDRMEGLLTDAQMDSIVTNVRLASASIQKLSADLSSSSGGIASTMTRADSAFARIDRLTASIEAGQGTLGRLDERYHVGRCGRRPFSSSSISCCRTCARTRGATCASPSSRRDGQADAGPDRKERRGRRAARGGWRAARAGDPGSRTRTGACPKATWNRTRESGEAALREVSEETGLDDLVLGQELATIDWYFRAGSRLVHKFCAFYLMRSDAGDPIPEAEEGITACVWVPLTEAEARISYDNAREVVRAAREMVLDGGIH